MKLRFSLLLLACFALLSSGCSTVATRIQSKQQAFDSATPEQQKLIREGRIGLGFTPDQVLIALGEPDRISVRSDRLGTSEIWSYYTSSPDINTFEYLPGPPYGYYPRGRFYNGYSYGSPFSSLRSSSRDLYVRVTFRDGKVISFETNSRR
jgi:hypothetical protein